MYCLPRLASPANVHSSPAQLPCRACRSAAAAACSHSPLRGGHHSLQRRPARTLAAARPLPLRFWAAAAVVRM